MAPKRVVFVLPSFAGGGAERVLLTFASAADRMRIAPEIVALDGVGPWQDLVPADIPVTNLGKARIRQAPLALARHLRRRDPDIVVSTIGALNLAVLAIGRFLPAKARVYVREANTPRMATQGGLKKRLLRSAYRRLYPRAAGVIVPARYLGDELAAEFGVPAAKIAVVHNPVDEQAIRVAAASPRRASGAGLRYVAVGRLTHQKGFDRLLAMVAQAPRDAHVTILGEGPDRAALEAQRRALELEERVAMPGFDRAASAIVAGADALLLPSRWEGLPNVALEALAVGTPVIATPEAGGIGEIAALASPGAVTLAKAGPDFIAAMARVPGNAAAALRPSALPGEFRLARAVARLLDAIGA